MKKISKLAYLLIILIAFNIDTFGQQFGIKASGGISRIYGDLQSSFYPEPPMTTSFSPSFQAGLFCHLPTGNKTSFGAELVYSKVQGAQTFKWENSYYTVDNISNTIYEQVSWLTLPVYYGITFNRLTLNAGFQISHALSASKEDKVHYMLNGEKQELDNPQSTNFNVNNFDFGPRAGITYQLNNRLSLEGMFYYGLNNINYSKSSNEELKVQQMTVGLRYALKDKQDVNLTSFANQQWGIKAGGGLSKITSSIRTINATPITPFVPSGQVGLFYSYPLKGKSSLGAELLFSQIEGKEKLEFDLTDIDGNKAGFASDILYRHISYLSIPVYYGYTFKWLTFNGGLQVSYALASSGREKNNVIVYEIGGKKESYTNKTDDINITRFDFGPRAGVVYQLNSKMSVEASYYYGLNNILKDGSPAWKLGVQQVSVGVRYALWNSY